MKILVTGATGFLGPHLVRRLKSEGADVVALIRKTSRTSHIQYKGLRLIEGNLRDRESVRRAASGVDVIVHAATSKGGPWPEFYADNVQSTEWLLEEAVRNEVKRFVLLSSVSVYDHSRIKNGDILDENSPKEPHPNFYAQSKIEAEMLVEKYHRDEDLATTIIRPACIYGSGGNWYPSRLGFSAGKNYAVLGRGGSVVPLSHTDSVTDVIWRSIVSDTAVGQAYNVVEDEPVSRIMYLQLTREHLFPDMKVVRFPYWLARFIAWGLRTGLRMVGQVPPTRLAPQALRLFALSVFYDNQKARNDLGWQPLQNVRRSIVEMLKWHREQKKPVSHCLVPAIPVRIHGEKKLKTALVGAGAFAITHLDILKQLQQAEVVALCDPDIEAARTLAARYRIPQVFASQDELVNSQQVDVIDIVSPPQTHASLAIQAMKQGCHVLVEKPMAVNAKEARDMISAAEKNGVMLCVEHSNLYDPSVIQAREWLNRGEIGRVIQMESWFGVGLSKMPMSPYIKYDGRDHWVYQLPGGVYQNFISHPLSCVLDFMGPLQNVKATAVYHKVVPHQNSDELRILFDNGSAIGTLSLSLCAIPRYNFIRIYGSEGTIEIDILSKAAFLHQEGGALPKFIVRNLNARKRGRVYLKAGRQGLIDIIKKKGGYFEGNDILIRLFFKSLIEKTPLPVTLENGLWSMETMDEIWKQIGV
jgi:predicted dehydrogenase/nucleoside-diphosphate-sugar epimerase